jgi:hypothetical protein
MKILSFFTFLLEQTVIIHTESLNLFILLAVTLLDVGVITNSGFRFAKLKAFSVIVSWSEFDFERSISLREVNFLNDSFLWLI